MTNSAPINVLFDVAMLVTVPLPGTKAPTKATKLLIVHDLVGFPVSDTSDINIKSGN